MNIIQDKKVTLIPLNQRNKEVFFNLFLELVYQENAPYYMQEFKLAGSDEEIKEKILEKQQYGAYFWLVYPQLGKASDPLGIITLEKYRNRCTVYFCFKTDALQKVKNLINNPTKLTYEENTIKAMLEECCSIEGVTRISTYVLLDIDNTVLPILLHKCGFVQEAILRKYIEIENNIKDVLLFTFLNNEEEDIKL